MLKKFDAIEYLVKKYVEDGEHATIPIIFKDGKRMFNKYDPTQTSLDSEVYQYLDKCSYNLPVKYKILIDVVSDELTEPTKKRFEEAVRTHYGLKVFDNNIDLRRIRRKTIILGILGIIIILAICFWDLIDIKNALAGTTMTILKEILTVAGWVFAWDALENIIFDGKQLLETRQANIQMLNAEFIFETENEYYKILKQEETETIEKNEEYEEIRESFLDQ